MEKELVEALSWYLEDDKRSVEMGILENIELRPAFAVLQKYAAQQGVQADGAYCTCEDADIFIKGICEICGKPKSPRR